MSREHLWAALGRARLDLDFSGRLLLDPTGAVRDAGYELTGEELAQLRAALTASAPAFRGATGIAAEDIQFQREKMRERANAQVARGIELGSYTVNILKETLDNARSAYHRITLMNSIMFFTGVGLFLAAAAYGAVSKDTGYTLVLAGLGTANFVALFVLGPIERTQTALSNLVQVEIAFMNYFEQITFWESYAFATTGEPPTLNPAHVKEASEQLQRRSQETIHLLQTYVEVAATARVRRTAAAAEKS